MADSWRSTPSSLTLAIRSITSASETPRRSPSTANGRGSRGKSHCTALSSSRSSASSWSSLVVVVMASWSRVPGGGGQLRRSSAHRGCVHEEGGVGRLQGHRGGAGAPVPHVQDVQGVLGAQAPYRGDEVGTAPHR